MLSIPIPRKCPLKMPRTGRQNGTRIPPTNPSVPDDTSGSRARMERKSGRKLHAGVSVQLCTRVDPEGSQRWQRQSSGQGRTSDAPRVRCEKRHPRHSPFRHQSLIINHQPRPKQPRPRPRPNQPNSINQPTPTQPTNQPRPNQPNPTQSTNQPQAKQLISNIHTDSKETN